MCTFENFSFPGTGVKIALATVHFHGFGVACAGPWNTSVNRGKKMVEALM
jgi:hypothetical protein